MAMRSKKSTGGKYRGKDRRSGKERRRASRTRVDGLRYLIRKRARERNEARSEREAAGGEVTKLMLSAIEVSKRLRSLAQEIEDTLASAEALVPPRKKKGR